jgi:7-cyano-7-deazaguanine synthase
MSKDKYVLVLLSGGIDSLACINYYRNLNFITEGLFIDYGQKSNQKELDAASKVANYYNILLHKIMINTTLSVKDGFINGRNLLLVSIALTNFPRLRGIISLGIHSGTLYSDCSKEFVLKAQSLIDISSTGGILIDCPFLSLTKHEIYNYCLVNKLPLDLTYSCENGLKQPCGKCNSCKDLFKLYESKNNHN